jgi:hypothetical protein
MISVGKGALAPFSYVFVCGLLVFGKLSWALGICRPLAERCSNTY